MKQISMKMTLSYLRIAGAVQAELQNAASKAKLEFSIVTHDIGWFYSTIVFKVIGPQPVVLLYKEKVEKWIQENQ